MNNINNKVANLQRGIIENIKSSRSIENGDGNINVQFVTFGEDEIIYGIRIAARIPYDRSQSCNGGDYYEDITYLNSQFGIMTEYLPFRIQDMKMV